MIRFYITLNLFTKVIHSNILTRCWSILQELNTKDTMLCQLTWHQIVFSPTKTSWRHKVKLRLFKFVNTNWHGHSVKKCLSQDHLLGLGCHYFSREGGGLGGTTLSLWHFVTIFLGRVGVKAIMDNVTKYEVFFFWRRPLVSL